MESQSVEDDLIDCTSFLLSQDDTFIYIKIQDLHYPKSETSEYHVDQGTFTFYMQPYQLKLNLSHSLNAEGENNNYVYKKEKATVTCRVEKMNKGEVFEGLDKPMERVMVPATGAEEGGEEDQMV